MTTKVFAYKGNLGMVTDMDNGKFINNPKTAGQLGCVVHSKEVEITPEAKKLLKTARRDRGSFSEIMLTQHGDGSGSSLGIMGFGKCHFGTAFSIGRTCELSVIDDFNEVDFEVPKDYKDFIDGSMGETD